MFGSNHYPEILQYCEALNFLKWKLVTSFFLTLEMEKFVKHVAWQFRLTHFNPMFHLWKNQVDSF